MSFVLRVDCVASLLGHPRAARTAVMRMAILATCFACACSTEHVPSDASFDASDGTLVHVPDARIERDAAADAVDDGESGASDASADAFQCTCTTSSACRVAECGANGACVERPAIDGAACGESSTNICVAGACVTRSCGDGYLEPGPSPVREACDDGNNLDGDACSVMCEPTRLVVDVSGDASYAARPLGRHGSIGVDGAGNLLFVSVRDRGASADLVARRASASGVFEQTAGADFIEIDRGLPSAESADPVVVGLPTEGWVVVWSAPRDATQDIVARVVFEDGSLGDEARVSERRTGVQEDPSVAMLPNGLVVGWTDRHVSPLDPLGGVRARRFTFALEPISGDLDLATNRGSAEQHLTLAAIGSTWLAVWARVAGEAPAPRLAARRFMGSSALDTNEVEVTGAMSADQPQLVARPDSLSFLLVGRTTDADAQGDLVGAELSLSNLASAAFVSIASTPAHRERLGALASFASEAYAVVEHGTPVRSYVRNLVSDDDPKLTFLNDALSQSDVENAAMIAGARGFWITWSEIVPGESARRFSAYSIPYGVFP